MNAYYEPLLCLVLLAAPAVFLLLMFISAPYGKQNRGGWGPGINVRLAWILWELPSLAGLTWFYWNGAHTTGLPALILFSLWFAHYFHRTFIYPFRIRVKPGEDSKLVLLVFATIFNAINGSLNGYFLSSLGNHLWTIEWLYSPAFIIGLAVFFSGLAINKQSDAILRALRKPGEQGYKIPQGGMYRWISCPNFFGESIQWLGFAIAAWSLPALAFTLFTLANLLPRALDNHRWYKETFADYPAKRKAFIPGIL